MTTGTGLDAQLGYKLETTVGTEVTVDKFIEFDSESLAFDPSFIEPTGLRVGTKHKRGSRLVQSRNMVSGQVAFQYATRDMGGLWKAALGSSVTTPTLVLGDAYTQIHQTGDLLGKSLTLQVGRPEPDGTVRPHTFRGCKVTSWEFSCSDNDTARMTLDVDGWDEETSTALATAAYDTGAEVFSFNQAGTFTLGGTVTGTTDLTVSGGTAVTAIVRGITIKGDNALHTERFGLGNSGIKKEQLENGTPTITGTLDVEYDRTEWYDPFKANTAQALFLQFEGSVISGSDVNTLEFLIPEMRIKKVSPQVSGPDIVQASVEFEVYSDETHNPFQVRIISGDATAI